MFSKLVWKLLELFKLNKKSEQTPFYLKYRVIQNDVNIII